jgi:hypothetical protein
MRKLLISVVFLGMFAHAPAAPALSLDLNLSDDAAEFKLGSVSRGGILETQFSWLHEQDRGDLLGLGLHMVDDANPGGSPLRIGIGGRLLAIDTPGPDGMALAVGGHFRYTLPGMNRLGLGGELYYAPSIVSGGDLERHLQWALRAEYQILRQANLYAGYRRVRPNFGQTVTFESGMHVGLRLDF